MKKLLTLAACTAFMISHAACLKTRAQLRGDEDEAASAKPVPAQVQEVPQNQYAIDEIKGAITQLTGRIEDLERKEQQQGSAKDTANKEEIKKLESRIVELEQAQAAMLESLKKMQASAPATERPDLFEKAKENYKDADYEAAVAGFSEYLKAPKSQHFEEATFLRGESYFFLKQYKKAIQDYSKFPEKYHRSKRLPLALQRIGASFEALGMKEDAKAFYQELIEKFPKSPEAKKVRSKLK